MIPTHDTHFMHSRDTHNRAFTLIELLVVISIIGMLSSVVFASLQSARDKGQVGAAIKFATYNQRLLGTDAIVTYTFNETPAVTVPDFSGNNYTATLTGCATSPHCRANPADSPTNTGNALSLNGTSQFAYYSSPTQLTPTNLTSITGSVWIKSSVLPVVPNIDVILAVSSNPNSAVSARNLYMDLRSGGLFIDSAADAGTCSATFANAVIAGKWTNITVSVNGSAGTVYLNGKVLGTLTGCDGLSSTIAQRGVFIGSILNGAGGDFFAGLIDDVVVYNRNLASSEVEAIYAQGAAKRGLAVAE